MSEYVDRDAVTQMISKWADGYSYIEVPTDWAEDEVRKIPAADVAPVRHGRWFHSFGGWLCSECNDQAPFWCMASTQNLSNYCPNCGARMDGGADDECVEALRDWLKQEDE